MKKPILVVVVGATAVGKTSFSVRLAKALHTEIVYADSRQIYQELAIGTAKPTKEEQEDIPHHLIDFLSVTKSYSAGEYERDALVCLEKIFARRPIALLSGGTGLYVRTLCQGIDQVPSDEKIREELKQLLDKEGLSPMIEELKLKDPIYYAQADLHNPQRVMRALEVIRASGEPYSSFRTGTVHERPFDIIKIGLARERAELYERIDKRIDLMLEAGLVAEAEKMKPFAHLNALQTVGYTEIFEYCEGKYDWAEAVRLLKRNSRRYAKRQMTWFGRDEQIQWFHPEDFERALAYILEKIG